MISLQDVQAAQSRIAPYITRTPLLRVPALDEALGCEVYLKFEGFQVMGAFKLRGAMNKALSLTQEELDRGIVCASSGNHAQGVACAAHRLGARAVIVMPTNANPVKTIGVEPAGADRYARSRAAGQPVTLDKVDTIADGTRTDHATLFNFEMIQDKVDELCTADDDHIRRAMVLLMTKAKLMVEPSGALPVAAALAGRLPVEKGQKVAFVLSGGNVDPALAARLLADVQA